MSVGNDANEKGLCVCIWKKDLCLRKTTASEYPDIKRTELFIALTWYHRYHQRSVSPYFRVNVGDRSGFCHVQMTRAGREMRTRLSRNSVGIESYDWNPRRQWVRPPGLNMLNIDTRVRVVGPTVVSTTRTTVHPRLCCLCSWLPAI